MRGLVAIAALLSLGAGSGEVSSLRKGLVLDVECNASSAQSATVVTDTSASHLHMTGVDTPTINAAPDGCSFNGSTQYFRTATTGFQSSSTLGTVAAWVKTPDTASGYSFFSSSDEGATGTYIHFAIGTSGQLYVQQQDNVDSYDLVETTFAGTLASWNHYAVTSDGSTWYLYVNGTLESSPNITHGANTGDWFGDTNTNGRDNITAGALVRTSAIVLLTGDIAGTKVWDRQLSGAEISALYNQGRPGADVAVSSLQKGLVGHWPLHSGGVAIGDNS